MSTLIISHYVYLTKEQRYDLHTGKPVETTGLNIPVWFNKGTTSEPAKELFCKYTLTNEPNEKIIKQLKHGYFINIPQKDEEEKKMLMFQQNTSESLLDVPDGGAEILEYKQANKIIKNNQEIPVVHFIEIKPIEVLESTLS